MNKLFKESALIKKQADKLLKESGIEKMLSTYGEVKIVGSYALDVMHRPDLDIYVITPRHNFAKAIKTVEKLLALKYFEEIAFADWLNYKTHGKEQFGVKGYYLQPKKTIGKNRWKLDIWLLTPDQYIPRTEKFEVLLKAGESTGKRIAILKLKQAYRSGSKYIGPINGKLIYEAVLIGGVRSKAEFESYLQKRGIKVI